MDSEISCRFNQKRRLAVCAKCDMPQNESEADFVAHPRALAEQYRRCSGCRSCIATAPFAQKKSLILLDLHARGVQDDVVVAPIEARLPLHKPSAVSLTAKLRIECSEVRTYRVLSYSLARGPSSCPTYRTSHRTRQRFQATSRKPGSQLCEAGYRFL